MVNMVSLVKYLIENRALCLTLMIAWVVSFGTAHGVILGDVQLTSRLGQPLEGTIDVHAGHEEQLFPECFNLKGTEIPVNMKFVGDIKKAKLLITSKTRVREPLVNLRLTVNCPELPKTIRQFAVFLDPPKAERPRFAEVERTILEPKPVVSRPAETKQYEAPVEFQRPVVTVRPPRAEKQALPKVNPLPAQQTKSVEVFALKLSNQLSPDSQMRIRQSERLAIPKARLPIATETPKPEPTEASDVIPSGPNTDFDDEPSSLYTLIIAVLLSVMLFVAWRHFTTRSGAPVKPINKDAMDWLDKEERTVTLRTEQVPSKPSSIDFEVHDLTAKMDLQDKGGHTIELDNESTRQLEESYLKELATIKVSEKEG